MISDRNETDERVFALIADLHDIPVKELHSLLPDLKVSEINWAVHRLLKRGRLTRRDQSAPKPRGAQWHYVYRVNPNPPPQKVRKTRAKALPMPAPVVLETRKELVQELRREVDELQAWKAQALERYPDLGVDPMILKAREIAAKRYDGKDRDAILSGRKDNCPVVQAVVDALESVAA